MKDKPRIFIPFLDGALNYDCRKCGSLCCKFGNLIVSFGEKRGLLQEYPALKYFFTQETERAYGLTKHPGCWFLENNGLCFIQKKYGFSYKPFICRAHPFYVVKCEDEYIVVQKGCFDLRVDARNKGIAHEEIVKNAEEAIDCDMIQKIDLPVKRLNLERRILNGSKAFLNSSDYLDFAAYQTSITVKNPDLAGIKSTLLGHISLWKSFLQIDELNLHNKRLALELTRLTSLLRIESQPLRQAEAKKVPLALLALYFYMLLFAKIRKLDTYVQTYEEILSNMALSLSYLKKDDLKISDASLEGRVRYLRQLRKLHKSKKS